MVSLVHDNHNQTKRGGRGLRFMTAGSLLFLLCLQQLLLLCLICCSTTSHATDEQVVPTTTTSYFECRGADHHFTYFGGGGNPPHHHHHDTTTTTTKMIQFPMTYFNDGYCDCPYDGWDEPNTAACSGSMVGGWSGGGIGPLSTLSKEPSSRYVFFSTIYIKIKFIPSIQLP